MAQKIISTAVDWEKIQGLLPVVVQDARSAQVLMLGYMNEQALKTTQQTGRVTFFSRSKNRLWMKGEQSGNVLEVVDYSLDCDGDALLIIANPMGPTCHTGTVSCFSELEQPDWVFFAGLERLIASRKGAEANSSYTASLYAQGTKRIAQKVGEEGVETALAAAVGDKAETCAEAADLLYHLTVLLQDAQLSWQAVMEVLKARHKG